MTTYDHCVLLERWVVHDKIDKRITYDEKEGTDGEQILMTQIEYDYILYRYN